MNAPSKKLPAAFSLIELLVVLAVIALMVSLLLPAISGFTGSTGRRGAVHTIMNTFELARVAALESGRPVYVLFGRQIFPEPDALMVLRETEGTGPYEQLTKWIPLPKKIMLHEPSTGESLLTDDPSSVFAASRMPETAALEGGQPLRVLKFNEAGSVAFPAASRAKLKLIIAEGVREANGDETLLGPKGTGGFEIISLSRYTGRAQLDVSTLQ